MGGAGGAKSNGGSGAAEKGKPMTVRIPLADMAAGQRARIVEVHGGRGVHHRLQLLGIRPGAVVTKISSAIRPGAVVVQVGGSQAAVGYGVARKIIVEIQR
jgi:ferrous iron transport protein A